MWEICAVAAPAMSLVLFLISRLPGVPGCPHRASWSKRRPLCPLWWKARAALLLHTVGFDVLSCTPCQSCVGGIPWPLWKLWVLPEKHCAVVQRASPSAYCSQELHLLTVLERMVPSPKRGDPKYSVGRLHPLQLSRIAAVSSF